MFAALALLAASAAEPAVGQPARSAAPANGPASPAEPAAPAGQSARRAATANETADRGPIRTPLRLGNYYRIFFGAGLGRGVRFNNPYRLQTPLGDTAESLSLTATYLDLWFGGALGPDDGFQHGAVVHGSIALDGVPQEVLTPSYIALFAPASPWLLFARGGLPVVIEPDANIGLETAAGGALFVSGAAAVTAELVLSLFYGAATLDHDRTTVPIVSLQVGMLVDYEVLP